MQVKGSGSDFTVVNYSVGASAYTEITPPSKYNVALIKARTDVAVLIKRKTGDTDYLTIPAGQSLELDIIGDTANTFFLKSGSGDITVEILWAR